MELPGSSPSQSATDVAQVQSPSRRAIINNGYKTKNVAEVWRGIQTAFSNGHHEDHELLWWCLCRAVYHGQSDVVRYLLEHESVQVDSLYPLRVAASPSTQLFQVLVHHGWNINQSDPDHGFSGAQYLLQLVCADESLVRWCLDHGASVEDPGHTDSYHCPPLLEIAADVRTVAIFTPLQSQGAQLSPCNLHRAVGSAAAYSSDTERLSVRLAMVKYLVDELGLDNNALDTETQDFNHWETLLCYAARIAHGGEEVVRFLLGRGADPYVKDCWGVHDAFSLAETVKEFRSLRAAT